MSLPAAQQPHNRPPVGWQAAALFCGVVAVLLLTMSGHHYARDEETLFAMTETLARYGHFDLAPDIPLTGVAASPGGGYYAPYGPLKPLLQLPLYLQGNVAAHDYPAAFQPFITRLYVAAFNPLVQGAIASLLFLLVVRLGYRVRTATLLALLFAFATFAFPHARTGFAEPLSCLLILLATYLLASATRGSRGWLAGWLAGACLALAAATKFQNLLVLPIFALWVLEPGRWLGWWRGRKPLAADALRPPLRPLWRRIVAFAVGFGLAYLPLGLYNSRAFGGPFTSGYGRGDGILLVTPFFDGLYDLLISPGKGYFWFAPPTILFFFAIGRFWRAQRSLAAVCLAIIVAHLIFYATNRFWHGDGSWGPRYLMPTLPFALLPIAALVEDAWAVRQYAMRAAVIGLAVLGLSGQLFGAAVNFDTYINLTYNQRANDTAAGDDYRYYTVAGSPLLGHARLLATRLGQWQANPPASLGLTSGWSVNEGAAANLPRWTNGQGVAQINYTAAYTLTVLIADHRPPSLPRAKVRVLLGDQPATASLAADGVHTTFAAASSGNHALVIASDTWNPAQVGIARDETLGVSVEQIAVYTTEGLLPLAPAPNLPAMPLQSAKQRFDWFYRTDYPHLLDHWYWYASRSGLDPAAVARLSGAVGWPCLVLLLVAGGCLLIGRRNG